MKIIDLLRRISQNPWYWRSYLAGGMVMLVIALFFQHVLEYPPCIMCIQVRLLFTLLVIVSIAGLLNYHLGGANRAVSLVSHLSVVLIAASMLERSYMLLGTERGFVFADCGFDLGMPAWFDIERWLPSLYRVESSCGYTPEIIFGITMAELLMVLSVILLTLSVSVFIAALIPGKTKE